MIHDAKISPEISSIVKDISSCAFDTGRAVYRFEAKLPSIDPLAWLAGQSCSRKIYFSNKDNSCRYAAIGSAESLTDGKSSLSETLTHIEQNLQDCNARYFGGMCFDPDSPVAAEWKPFGRFYFVLPRIELFANGHECVLAANFVIHPDQDIDKVKSERISELCGLDFSMSQAPVENSPKAVNATDCPAMAQWLERADEIIEMLNAGDMSKLVLARKILLDMPVPVDALGVLSALSVRAAPTYDFCFQLNESIAFIGSSPETLYRSSGGEILTEALAGTALVGETDEETAAFSKQLCQSPKEQLEQNFVCDDVKSALGDLCSSITASQKTVVKLRTLQHLSTRFEGSLKSGITNHDMIDSLHPTAAVGGLPSDMAKERIRSCEAFSRGFYAGPVGYISNDASEFAVAIRSALITGKNVHLYAGAGLMAQSIAAAEWTETQNKLQQFLDILT